MNKIFICSLCLIVLSVMFSGCGNTPLEQQRETEIVGGTDDNLEIKTEVDNADNKEEIASEPEVIEQDNVNVFPTMNEEMQNESQTFIKKTLFENISRFEVTSNSINEYVWDPVITYTKYGENKSPELTWEAVDGATSYAVFMLDGAWLHMDVLTTETSLSEGCIENNGRWDQYVGPYPPDGTHTYSIFVFALKEESSKVTMAFNAGGNSIDGIYMKLDKNQNGETGNVIAYGRLDGNYTHKD